LWWCGPRVPELGPTIRRGAIVSARLRDSEHAARRPMRLGIRRRACQLAALSSAAAEVALAGWRLETAALLLSVGHGSHEQAVAAEGRVAGSRPRFCSTSWPTAIDCAQAGGIALHQSKSCPSSPPRGLMATTIPEYFSYGGFPAAALAAESIARSNVGSLRGLRGGGPRRARDGETWTRMQ